MREARKREKKSALSGTIFELPVRNGIHLPAQAREEERDGGGGRGGDPIANNGNSIGIDRLGEVLRWIRAREKNSRQASSLGETGQS